MMRWVGLPSKVMLILLLKVLTILVRMKMFLLLGWSVEKGIRVKMIVSEDSTVHRLDDKRRKGLTKVKKVSNLFNTPAVFNIYGDKTALILWSENPIVVLFEGAEITGSFLKYFEVLWKAGF